MIERAAALRTGLASAAEEIHGLIRHVWPWLIVEAVLVMTVTIGVLRPETLTVGDVVGALATFAAVFLAFELERRRSRTTEREEFGRLVQAVLFESDVSQKAAASIAAAAKVGSRSLHRVRMDALRLALTSERVTAHAPYSMVVALTRIDMELRAFDAFCRQLDLVGILAAVSDGQFAELEVRALATRRRIRKVLQPALELPADLTAKVVKDEKVDAIRKRLASIEKAEREALVARGLPVGSDPHSAPPTGPGTGTR